MTEKPIIVIVATQCQPADEEKFNRWYNEVHIPMLLKSDKLKGVARYKVIVQSPELPRYIAIYKYNSLEDFQQFSRSPEMAADIKEMQETWGQQIEITSRVQYEMIKEWEK